MIKKEEQKEKYINLLVIMKKKNKNGLMQLQMK